MSDRIDKIIDRARQLRPSEPRDHMGASKIGDACLRAIWYSFRWAYQVKHTGRLLRLFDRGHEEEHRFARYLREAGAEVQDYSQRLMYHDGSDSYTLIDWEDDSSYVWSECSDVSADPLHIERATARGQGPKQWGFVDHGGHFAGSADGKIVWEKVLPPGKGLLEEKTHSLKSFEDLVKKGVLSSKPTHYFQMQVYLHYLDLPWGLYIAVCKNDDQLYPEIVHRKEEIALQLVDRAKSLIFAVEAPKRYSTDPSWFQCRMCDYREICHYDAKPQKNCRSCALARPQETGGWYCNKYHAPLPKDFIPKGCDGWDPIK